jgi:hypothetical protein
MIYHSHPPLPSLTSSIIVGKSSTLSVTFIGYSVLPGLFHLNNVLIAPRIIQNLIFVRLFTNKSCSFEFDPFGLSVKDLATRTLLVRCDSSGRYTHSCYLLPPSPCPPSIPWLTPLYPSLGIVASDTLANIISKLSSNSIIYCSMGYFDGLCHACHLGRHAPSLSLVPPPRLLRPLIIYTVICGHHLFSAPRDINIT